MNIYIHKYTVLKGVVHWRFFVICKSLISSDFSKWLLSFLNFLRLLPGVEAKIKPKCEALSNLNKDDHMMLENSQFSYLTNVMDVSKAVPVAALGLYLGVLPIRYEIEMR